MFHAVSQLETQNSTCTHHCVTSQRPGTSETCSIDIYSCFSYGSGSSGHTCRKWALTWLFFEKSPAGDRKKPMGKDAGNCQGHAGPSPPTHNTCQVDFQRNQTPVTSSLLLFCSNLLLQFDRGIKFSKSWRRFKESARFKGHKGCNLRAQLQRKQSSVRPTACGTIITNQTWHFQNVKFTTNVENWL